MKYSSSNIKILVFISFVIFSIISVESRKKFRVATNLAKALYKTQTESDLFTYFSEKGLFNADNTLAPFQIAKDTKSVSFIDRIFSKENKIDKSKGTFDLKDNCNASYQSEVFTMSYNNVKVKFTDGKDTVDANASFVVAIQVLIEKTFSSELTGEFSFNAKYTSLEIKSVESSNETVKTFLNENIALLKSAVSKEYDVIVSNSVTVLNDFNSLSIDLRTTLLTDSKSRSMTISRVENPNCSTEYIIEKFSSQIFSGYEPAADVNYEFTDSEDQIFYDISLIDEFLKSKTNNMSFSFLYNKENGVEYNSLGFTIKDLANIFPSVLSQFRGTQEYLIECGITKAFSKVVNKLNSNFEEFVEYFEELKEESFSVFDLTKLHSHPILRDTFLLNSASLKCDIKADTQVVETVNLLVNFDMSKDKVDNDLVFSLNNLYLIDYSVNSKVYVNDKALSHFILSSLRSYFNKNPLSLFKLDVTGKEYRFNKEGTLVFKPKPKEQEDVSYEEEFLKYLK